jgi:hypothetical protein
MSNLAVAVRPWGNPSLEDLEMNHSLIGADRTTHLKIVSVALAGAIAVVTAGISARMAERATAAAGLQAVVRVLEAGKPMAFALFEATTVQ